MLVAVGIGNICFFNFCLATLINKVENVGKMEDWFLARIIKYGPKHRCNSFDLANSLKREDLVLKLVGSPP